MFTPKRCDGLRPKRVVLDPRNKATYVLTYIAERYLLRMACTSCRTYVSFSRMKVDLERMLRASDVRTNFSAVLDDSAAGRVTHVVREGRVVAHIVPVEKKVVPANALVHDGNELLVMMGATLASEAECLATDVGRSGFHEARDSIGNVLGWIWHCDPRDAVQWLARYSIAVTDEFERRGWARPAFAPLWRGLRTALGGRLSNDEIAHFERDVRDHLGDYPTPFSSEEIAGEPRSRRADDPWPDSTATGIGWAKKRWSSVAVNEFVPNPERNFELGINNEDWCRVTSMQVPPRPSKAKGHLSVQLARTDGSEFGHQLPDRESLIPFQEHGPYRWGRP